MEDLMLKALGDPKRFQLLRLVSERTYCVKALAQISRLSESAVSQHLKILREAGLVYGVKRGYYTHYTVDKDALGRLISELDEMRNMQRTLCSDPFYGCPQAEAVRCKSYVPPDKRGKEENTTC